MERLSHETALDNLTEVHGSRYRFPYIESEYVWSKSMITGVCEIHGEFVVRYNHLSTGSGCPTCGKLLGFRNKRLSHETALDNLNEVHGSRYRFPYIESEYIGYRSMITGVCEIHGEFHSKYEILIKGCGCQSCGASKLTETLRLTPIQALDNLTEVHGSRYHFPYIESEYVDSDSAITGVCALHGEFRVRYTNLKSRGGCQCCGLISAAEKHCNVTGRSGLADYVSYSNRLLITDCPTEGTDGELQVRCKLCGGLMTPTLRQVLSRINSISSIDNGESNFYCSDKCKSECAVYGKHSDVSLPNNVYVNKVKRARGCQGGDKFILRQLQFDECGYYFCEKCGKMVNSPELHHTIEVAKDPDGAVTVAGHMLVCSPCHKVFTKMCR